LDVIGPCGRITSCPARISASASTDSALRQKPSISEATKSRPSDIVSSPIRAIYGPFSLVGDVGDALGKRFINRFLAESKAGPERCQDAAAVDPAESESGKTDPAAAGTATAGRDTVSF
jgi:hypothetical protein